MAKSTTKSWAEKMQANGRKPEVSVLEKDISDMKAGQKMLVATPTVLADYLKKIPAGQQVGVKQIRADLASQYQADHTCPLTTGIFLRIVAEYAYEQMQAGIPAEQTIPFWRAIDKKSTTAKKLSFGYEPVEALRQKEGLEG